MPVVCHCHCHCHCHWPSILSIIAARARNVTRQQLTHNTLWHSSYTQWLCVVVQCTHITKSEGVQWPCITSDTSEYPVHGVVHCSIVRVGIGIVQCTSYSEVHCTVHCTTFSTVYGRVQMTFYSAVQHSGEASGPWYISPLHWSLAYSLQKVPLRIGKMQMVQSVF